MDLIIQAARSRKRALGICLTAMLALSTLLLGACLPEKPAGDAVPIDTRQPKISRGSASQCPDAPSKTLLPPQPLDIGFSATGAPVPDTAVTISGVDEMTVKVPYDTTLRAIFDIPEYHDCQRLMLPMRNGTAYGPLAGIFALDATHAPYTAQDFEQKGGVAVAMIYNFTDNQPIYPGQAQNDVVHPNPASDQAGFGRRSCLYLAKVPVPQGEKWEARLWHIPTSLAICPNKLTESMPTLALNVIRTTPMPDTADYPPAARWDLSEDKQTQYMAVRCLAGWCEMGPGQFSPSVVINAGADRNHTVKGWFDQQYLAIKPPTGGGPLVPSTMLGTFYPEADLRQLTIADYSCMPALVPPDEPFRSAFDPHASAARRDAVDTPRRCAPDVTTPLKVVDDAKGYWRKVGSIRIPQADLYYRRKFMLNAEGNAFVYLRYNPVLPQDLRWQVRYGSDSGSGKVVKAVRVDHSQSTYNGTHVVVPSTVRWKWVSEDEQTWSACSEGCCNGIDL